VKQIMVKSLTNSMRSRTIIVAVILLAIAAWSGCSKKQEQNNSATAGPPGEISGTVTISPELKDKVGATPLLMIVASPSADPKIPALVVKREAGVSFPYQYKLTSEDITLVGSRFDGKMYVTARIDPAGMVGPPRPGTFDGSYSGNPVRVGSSKIDIVINKAY
jgi:hypothetical protein